MAFTICFPLYSGAFPRDIEINLGSVFFLLLGDRLAWPSLQLSIGGSLCQGLPSTCPLLRPSARPRKEGRRLLLPFGGISPSSGLGGGRRKGQSGVGAPAIHGATLQWKSPRGKKVPHSAVLRRYGLADTSKSVAGRGERSGHRRISALFLWRGDD